MRAAKLIVTDHEGETFEHAIGEPETLIGRSASADVRLSDRSISREHAAISWEGDHYVLEDLQTTNGTRLNGKRIRSGELSDRDRINLGQTEIAFHYTKS